MKHGDLVKLRTRQGRKNWVALHLTRAEILRHRLNAPAKTGLYLVSGYWYDGGPLHVEAYGKIDGLVTAEALKYRVTTRIRGHRAAHKHLR